MRTCLVAFIMLCSAGTAHGDAPRVTDLREADGWLPYRFEVVKNLEKPTYLERGWITTYLPFDTNGDGATDGIRTGDYGIYHSRRGAIEDISVWQNNLPVRFGGRYPCCSVNGIWDVDRNGSAEVVVTAWTEDARDWLVRLIDLDSGNVVRDIRLAGGPDSRPDGRWDGHYRVIGPLDVPVGDGGRPALLVAAEAGLDLEPRGVMALDVGTGDVLWRYLTGPKPTVETLRIVDLDGDDSPEVIFVGSGVDNLRGRRINGLSDDRSALYVVNRDGTLRWSRELGPAPSGGGLLDAMDLDGDGRREIVIAAFLPEYAKDGLAVIDCDNRLTAWQPLKALPTSMAVAQLADGSHAAYVSYNERMIDRYGLNGDRIELSAEAEMAGIVRLSLVADLVDRPGPEVLVGSASGVTWLLGEDLSPLARLDDEDFRFAGGVATDITVPDGARRLVNLGAPNSHFGEFMLVANARPFPWWLVAPAASLTGGGLLAWRWRRKPHSTATKRELRIQLLGRLQLSGHGAIGALSSLRRLIWHLDTLMQGFAADAQVVSRLTALTRDTLDVGLPNLEAVLEVAEIVDLDPDGVRHARTLLQELKRILHGLAAAGFAEQDLRAAKDELHDAAAEAERSFQRLRRSLERQFRADPRTVIDRSLAAHAPAIDELAVEVVFADAPSPPCRIDEEELAFILDNLIENALRAMRQSPRRRLTIDWQVAGSHVVITVADTGSGLTPDDREAVLTPGYSRREGGGLGLPRSRELLGKYGGDISVRESAPGQGTVMALLLPRGGGVAGSDEVPPTAH